MQHFHIKMLKNDLCYYICGWVVLSQVFVTIFKPSVFRLLAGDWWRQSADLNERNKPLKPHLVTSHIFSSAVVAVSHWWQQLPRSHATSVSSNYVFCHCFFLFRQPSIQTLQIFWNLQNRLLRVSLYPVAPRLLLYSFIRVFSTLSDYTSRWTAHSL